MLFQYLITVASVWVQYRWCPIKWAGLPPAPSLSFPGISLPSSPPGDSTTGGSLCFKGSSHAAGTQPGHSGREPEDAGTSRPVLLNGRGKPQGVCFPPRELGGRRSMTTHPHPCPVGSLCGSLRESCFRIAARMEASPSLLQFERFPGLKLPEESLVMNASPRYLHQCCLW